MRKRFEVNVAGVNVVLLSEESDDYIASLVREIENKTKSFIYSGKDVGVKEALLMCSLDSLDTEKKLKKENEALKAELEKLRRV